MFTTKLILSNEKSQQLSGQTLTLSGTTNIAESGVFSIQSGATFSILDNKGDGKLPISDSSGVLSLKSLTSSGNTMIISQNSESVNLEFDTSLIITGGTNGLTKDGSNLKLGGTLTDTITCISGSTGSECVNYDSLSGLLLTNTNCFSAKGSDGYEYIYGDGSGFSIGALDTSLTPSTGRSSYICGDFCNFEIVTCDDGIIYKGITGMDINGKMTITANGSGANNCGCAMHYAEDYGPTFNVSPRAIPDVAFVTALTSGSTTITVSNGLEITNDNITLGGILTGNTSISGATYNLDLGTSSSQLGDLSVYGTNINLSGVIKFLSSPASGNTSTDNILSYNPSDNTVKQVSTTSLGEDNNTYIVDVVTSTSSIPTSGYTILVNHSSDVTLTLPASPTDGQAYKIKDASGTAYTNIITISGNGNNIDGSASATINTNYGAVEIVYDSSLDEWYSLGFIN